MQDAFDTVWQILDERYSCRGYLDVQVSEAVIRKIVAAASKVPTWCNAQPWHVVVTRGAETEAFAKVLTKAAQSSQMQPDFTWPERYTGVFQDRRRTCGYQLYAAVEISRDDYSARSAQMMENFRFFGAPHVAIVTTATELGPYGAMDTGGFIALFTIAARALGIGTVAQASVTGYAPVIRRHFDIPDSRLIQTAISFGYDDPKHPANAFRTDRAEIEDVLDFVG